MMMTMIMIMIMIINNNQRSEKNSIPINFFIFEVTEPLFRRHTSHESDQFQIKGLFTQRWGNPGR